MSVYGDTWDPRPRLIDDNGEVMVVGQRCVECRHAVVVRMPRCPRCQGDLDGEVFGPAGTVWSSTVVRIPLGVRTPPNSLAYVDLDDGPRLLTHADGDLPLPVGAAVRVAGLTPSGDVLVARTGSETA